MGCICLTNEEDLSCRHSIPAPWLAGWLVGSMLVCTHLMSETKGPSRMGKGRHPDPSPPCSAPKVRHKLSARWRKHRRARPLAVWVCSPQRWPVRLCLLESVAWWHAIWEAGPSGLSTGRVGWRVSEGLHNHTLQGRLRTEPQGVCRLAPPAGTEGAAPRTATRGRCPAQPPLPFLSLQ